MDPHHGQQDGHMSMSQHQDFSLPNLNSFSGTGPGSSVNTAHQPGSLHHDAFNTVNQQQGFNPLSTGHNTPTFPATPQNSTAFSFGMATPAGGTPGLLGGLLGHKRPRLETHDDFSASPSPSLTSFAHVQQQQAHATALQNAQHINSLTSRMNTVEQLFQYNEMQLNEVRTENEKLRIQHTETMNVLGTMQKQVAELEAALEARDGGDDVGSKEAGARRKNELAAAIRRHSLALIGSTPIRPTPEEIAAGKPAQQEVILRDPLQPGEQPQTEGGIELHHPDWLGSPKDLVNVNFVHAVANCVMHNDKQMMEENGYTLQDAVKAAETHFRTLVGKYKAQVSETAATKKAKKATKTKIGRRKDTKFAWRINAARWMETKRGEEVKGCVALVEKGWMSSDDDEPGNVEADVWKKRVSEVSTETKVWETHRLLWRDPKLVRFYYALDHIAYTEMKVKGQAQRFHGFHANDNQTRPNMRNTMPYTGTVSSKWMCVSGNTLATKDMPAGINFEGLVITDRELSAQDLAEVKKLEAYEADDEEEYMKDPPIEPGAGDSA